MFDMLSTRFSVESLSSRLSGEKPLPKPFYYGKMNPQEQVIWGIIVSFSLPVLENQSIIPFSLIYIVLQQIGFEKNMKRKIEKKTSLTFFHRAKKNTTTSTTAKANYTSGDSALRSEHSG